MSWHIGVAGKPISHSRTPIMQRAVLEELSIEGTVQTLEIDLDEATMIRELFPDSFNALSVTMPLKTALFGLCDATDDASKRIGAVNSLLFRDGVLHGRNVDGEGFVNAVEGECQAVVDGMHVVVLGSGGSASAIVDGLISRGVESISIHARNVEAVHNICGRYQSVSPYSKVYRPVDLIVNTTPSLTRQSESDVLQGVSAQTVAVDITYDPMISSWLALHADAGCVTSNGLAMLAYQAALQFEWWFDSTIDPRWLLGLIS
jgi:shikimate dehydrogenase